jgi:hypothetical protein
MARGKRKAPAKKKAPARRKTQKAAGQKLSAAMNRIVTLFIEMRCRWWKEKESNSASQSHR